MLYIELILTFLILVAGSRHYLHMLQLESYQLDGYKRHLEHNRQEIVGWPLYTGVICLIAQIVLPVFFTMFTGERRRALTIAHVLIMIFAVLYAGYSIYRDFIRPQKKPLGFTKRFKRLALGLIAAAAVICALFGLIFGHTDSESKRLICSLSPFVLVAGLPFLTMLAGLIMQPVENKINMGFYKAAQSKLDARKDLIKIGITGSYGKTSTKFALYTILSEKYNVLTSQSSINTPMGLSKLINTELKREHQVFIAEMGARHVGDIKELTDLVHPTIGLITSVGPQHLETFGNIETVAKTKNELIEALPADGLACFASDGAWVDKLYKKAKNEKYISGIGEGYDLSATDIETGDFGSRFTLVSKEGERLRVETKLLGRHNISNLVLCCCAAYRLGLTMEEIASGLKKIKPVEHRLQLLPGDLNVIDDAFNSNPTGAQEALNVLASFPGRHLIITPGFVEMGEDEDKYNFALGKQIASSADAAILVGPKHTKPIREGMLKAGFAAENILTVYDLDEAAAHIRDFIGSGDAVLFENDLPDNYNEKK